MRCRRCGTEFPPEIATWMRYCGACGVALGGGPSGNEEAPSRGELRFATVLFADLAGFTEFAEERPPDEVASLVSEFLHRLGDTIEQLGGTVDKFIGDAVMATFGLERPDPTAARNAVRAGLKLQEVTAEFRERYGLHLELRVGIHAGEVMFITVGGSRTVMGDTVNTAARIQGVATPGEVWISRPVYEKVRRYVHCLPQPSLELRGKKKAVQPFQVRGERKFVMIDVPQFVGRENEWAALIDALQATTYDKKLRIVALRGAAGIGKSRMVWELRERLEATPGSRLDVIQYDRAERLPSHGLAALIRSRFDLRPDLEEDPLWSLLRGGVRHELPGLSEADERRAAELFAFVLGFLRDDFGIHALDARGKWEATFQLLRDWIERWTHKGPWILVFEDAQKGDVETAAFLEWAATAGWHNAPLIVVTVGEEDFTPDSAFWSLFSSGRAADAITELRLRELPADRLGNALTAMEPRLSPALARRLAEHAEGNPLFATELVLLLRDKGALETADARGEFELPNTVREVMEARLERLGSEGREVAKRAALIGRRFSREAVSRIWDRPGAQLSEGVASLMASEAVYEETMIRWGSEPDLVFRNALLREAALARIPREEKERWLEQLELWARDKLEMSGEHWELAAQTLVPLIVRGLVERDHPEEASLWLEAWGHALKRQQRTRDAIAAYTRALDGATGVRRLVLLRRMGEEVQMADDVPLALALTRDLDQDSKGAQPAIPPELAERLWPPYAGPLDRWDTLTLQEARLALEMARADMLAHNGTAMEVGEVLEGMEARLGELRGRVAESLWARWAKATAHLFGEMLADPLGATEICRRVGQRLSADLPDADRLIFLRAQEIAASRSGHFDDAAKIISEQLTLAQRLRERRDEVMAWNSKGIVDAAMGRPTEAREAFQHALAISRAIGFQRREAISLHNLGLVDNELGEYARALEHQEQYRNISRSIGNRPAEAYGPAAQAAVALAQADLDAARRYLDTARRTSDENAWTFLSAWTTALEGAWELTRSLSDADPSVRLRGADTRLRAALEIGGKKALHWTEEFDPAEHAVYLAAAVCRQQGADAARAVLSGVRARISASYGVSAAWLDAAESLAGGADARSASAWFTERGYRRAEQQLARIAPLFGAGAVA